LTTNTFFPLSSAMELAGCSSPPDSPAPPVPPAAG